MDNPTRAPNTQEVAPTTPSVTPSMTLAWPEVLAEAPDDFLEDPDAAALVALAGRIESCRRELAMWASLTVVGRQPQVSPHRGIKGTRTLEADLDGILRGLVSGLRDQDPASLRRHAAWYTAVLATRSAGSAALVAELDVLHEGLLRWLGRAAAKPASDALSLAYERSAPAECAALLWTPAPAQAATGSNLW